MKSAKDIFYTEEEGALILDSRIIKKSFKVDLHQIVPDSSSTVSFDKIRGNSPALSGIGAIVALSKDSIHFLGRTSFN